MKRFAERVGSFSIFSNGSWTIKCSLSIVVTVLSMVNKVKARKEAAAVKILLI